MVVGLGALRLSEKGAALAAWADTEAAELRRLARRERDGRVAARPIAFADTGHHHHIAGTCLVRHVQEAGWREDERRAPDGSRVRRVVGLALAASASVNLCAYRQRATRTSVEGVANPSGLGRASWRRPSTRARGLRGRGPWA